MERFSIAQVTPYAWERRSDVNEFVREASLELSRRGHRVMVLAPSESRTFVRDSRAAVRAAHDDPASLLNGDGPRVLGVGEVLVRSSRRARSLPVDVARTIEEALTATPLDFVHVHEPFAPSAASAALRHSRSLNVGSFHAPTERVLSTQLGRRMVELFFGRLDARVASYDATRDLIARFFPGEYEVVRPGARSGPAATRSAEPPVIAFVADEERGALRLFLRALRRLPLDREWRALVWSPRAPVAPPVMRREVRERLDLADPGELDEAKLLSEADVVVMASSGIAPAPGLLTRALAAGTVPVAARLAVYEELLDDGELGLLFEPGDVETLSAQLTRLVEDPSLGADLRAKAQRRAEDFSWSRVVDELEEIYGRLAARRHPVEGDRRVRTRLAKKPLIDVDLHMHTDHSPDCATPVEDLLQTAKERGLGAIAITDHNEISGAYEAVEKADGIKVIVAEEVKTAHQGEVIGLFIEEKIERGMSLEETIAEIKRQGGLVYVPHPFDRLHSVPDYEHLLTVLDHVDAIEVFNPRVAIAAFNEEAARFAAKYRVVAGAGSDSHVVQGLGSVRIRMRDFDGPREFLESLREADIIRKPKSLLYVQALKFLQTKATPPPARRAARDRRVRKAQKRAATGERKS